MRARKIRNSKWAALCIMVLGLAIVPACGGGGGGFANSSNAITLPAGLLLPQLSSGQSVEFALPIDGGCGGPYVLRVIGGGALPEGIALDDRQANIEGPGIPAEHRHHIVGTALDDGVFNFTIEILDRGCSPASSMTRSFSWNINQGALVIVGANPPLIPAAAYNDPQKFHDIDALETTVFNAFTTIDFIVAGGVPPYSCTIVDDATDPDDDHGLPQFVTMPPGSCSLVGSPQEVGPGGQPFRITIRAQDSVGNVTVRKVQWKIDTPPIIMGTTDLTDGKAGTEYGDAVQVAEGVPPFRFEFAGELPSPNDNVDASWVYAPPAAPTFPSLSGFTVATTGEASNQCVPGGYPAEAAVGPYSPYPSEGIYLTETGPQAGSLAGVPRRVGQFTVIVHVHSTTVPNERGQHVFGQFTHIIEDSEPPTGLQPVPFGMDATMTLEGAFLTGAPGDGVGTLPEFAALSNYNPDFADGHAAPGLLLRALGGVPFDGHIDAPHASQRVADLQEVTGRYMWEVTDWDTIGTGFNGGNVPPGRPTGVELLDGPAGATFSDGVLATPGGGLDLERQGRQVITLRVADQQLPLGARHIAEHDVAISVGPDRVLITESAQAYTGGNSTTTGGGLTGMHDEQMIVKQMAIIAGSPVIEVLNDSIMVSNHTVPAAANIAGANPLGQLLSRVGAPAPGGPVDAHSLDFLRVAVNPSGWWNDTMNLHPKAARQSQRGDVNKRYTIYGDLQGTSTSWGGGNASTVHAGWQPSVTAVDLPDTPSVANAPGNGVYALGGSLYVFDKDSHFGVFIARPDGKVYVPFAIQKTTYFGFGDNVLVGRGQWGVNYEAASDSRTRSVQIAVSPDGRFAAAKLKVNPASFSEQASQSRIVLFSLTGEKPFGGETYKIIECGSPTPAGVLFGTSMVLTNNHLYFLIGTGLVTTYSATNTYISWRDHFVMRYEITGGAAGADHATGFGANWSNGALKQTPFHHWPSATTTASTWNYIHTNEYLRDGMNLLEGNTAPIPFRVSADGTSCAMLAGPNTASVSGSTVWQFYAWVDRDGLGFRQASNAVARVRGGGTRGHMLRCGGENWRYWARYEGPSGVFEISDDGLRVAYAQHESPNTTNLFSRTTTGLGPVRMNVYAASTSDNWVTTPTPVNITGTAFANTHLWRFGGLTFSPTGSHLVFWGGSGQVNPTDGSTDINTTNTTSTYHIYSAGMVGTYYAYDFSVTNQVKSVLPTSAGGTGFNTYSSGSPFNPATTAYSAGRGVIMPNGGFLSRDRTFLYVLTAAPMTSTDGTCNRLIGINLTNSTVNGHTAMQGFPVAGWPFRRGMLGNYYYAHNYNIMSGFIPHQFGYAGTAAMAKDTGVVYFASHSSYYYVTQSLSTSPTSVMGNIFPTHWADTMGGDGHIEAFASDVGGPIQRVTQSALSDAAPSSNANNAIAHSPRSIHFLELDRSGARLAFVFDSSTSTPTSVYYPIFNREGVGYAFNIGFNPTTGQLLGSYNRNFHAFLLEGPAGKAGTNLGRAGESMAFDSTGTRLYYAFGANAGDETNKQLVEVTVNAGTAGVTTGRFGTGARYNVLMAGR